MMVMFFQPVPMGIERNNKLGVKKEVYGLQGGFRLEKPVGFRASQAAESLRFQMDGNNNDNKSSQDIGYLEAKLPFYTHPGTMKKHRHDGLAGGSVSMIGTWLLASSL